MRIIIAFISLIILAGCKKNDPGSTVQGVDTIPLASQQEPSGLPKNIAFGTEGDISKSSQFIQETQYQYQYLSGNIFSNGWTTWNSPDGEFARNFLKKIDELGKIPVFTYYNIYPARDRFEDPPFTNLNDPEVMNAYFNDFKFLLQICGQYAKPVIIHYEPDLLGYMEMFKDAAVKSVIKVGASGQADVKNFSNDAQGLCQAIVSMRNHYAPNVLLGWHASQWATGNNLITDKHDPEQLATETANYYKSLNAKFDLIFTEFTDRDAGYDEIVLGKTNVEWSTQANASNGNISDYDRFQRFLKTLNRQTGQKIILWQIPIGNTLTATCNNTPGHYKNNTAEYFFQPLLQQGSFSKISQYSQAGVIAYLFGRGTADCTSYMDSKADGITGVKELSDDDGGYLRTAIKAYYQKGSITAP